MGQCVSGLSHSVSANYCRITADTSGVRAFVAPLLLPLLLPLQGWRVTAEVVAVLEPSRRRESVVGEQGSLPPLYFFPSLAA